MRSREGSAMNLDGEMIKAQLPGDWRELASAMGLIKALPPHLHAKVTDIEQVLRLELSRAGLELSLVTTTAMAAAAKECLEGQSAAESSSLVDISGPALHYWERKLGPYVAALLARMTGASEFFAAERWNGYVLVLVDGTTVTRPGAKGTTARVLYAMRLAEMSIVKLVVTDAHGSESLRHFEPKPGEVWMCDRFYANPVEISWVVDAGADVIMRLNRGMLPLYDGRRKSFDVLRHVRRLKSPGAMDEWTVWVRPEGHAPIQGRLCAVRLPDKEAQEARQRARREYGADVSPEILEAASWMMVFTTVPRERLSMERVLGGYRFRWQIELEIKRDKSIGGMDHLPNLRDDTIATWLYAKLLNQQIIRKIVSPVVAFPPGGPFVAAFGAALGGAGDAAPPGAVHRRRGLARRDVRGPSPLGRAVPHRAA